MVISWLFIELRFRIKLQERNREKFFGTLDDFARSKKVYSIKVDTNFDNLAMLAILEKLGYAYCGEVVFRESARKAFEKVLTA